MTDQTKQAFYAYYETGKDALEGGQYRTSVKNLEKALEVYPVTTKLGGEASIWLITAYQGVGDLNAAIALCRQLANHPNPSLSSKGKRLLYILEAPRLKRPPEWMTPIPTLTSEAEAEKKPQYVQAKPKKGQSSESQYQIEPVDLSQVNTKDNGFIWIALGVILLALGGAIWLS